MALFQVCTPTGWWGLWIERSMGGYKDSYVAQSKTGILILKVPHWVRHRHKPSTTTSELPEEHPVLLHNPPQPQGHQGAHVQDLQPPRRPPTKSAFSHYASTSLVAVLLKPKLCAMCILHSYFIKKNNCVEQFFFKNHQHERLLAV